MRHGSLCTGYGGIDLALGATTAWVSDVDKGANKVLAHRFPGVPNIGDMTTVDWAQVESVDILSGGYPCQPFSHAGRRKGRDDERNLWPYVREAIRVLQPRLTVLENVAGHRSLGFDRVLGDLAEDGMHVRWTSVRASDVGAPHQRERLFVLVTPADTEPLNGRPGGIATRGPEGSHTESAGRDRAPVSLLPTPRATDGTKGGPNQRGSSGDLMLLSAVHLLPTPTSQAAKHAGGDTDRGPGSNDDHNLWIVAQREQWGKYADAIAQWEHLTREAPAPTEPGRNGKPGLSPRFTEWMQGLPAGWITNVPGITRNEALRLCGNGVVPQQCAAAVRFLLSMEAAP